MAKGSHATWGGWEPRVCEVCGERVALTGKSALAHGGSFHRFEVATETGRSWHVDCRRRERMREAGLT